MNEYNSKACPRWNDCSINICPTDRETSLRNKLPGESCCPFAVRKKCLEQKGVRTLAPTSVLEVIPKSNVKMLNKRSQKRWHNLNK